MKTITLRKLKRYVVPLFKKHFWILLGLIYIFVVKPVDTVVFLDVGQGDSTLIQKGNTQILVDGGSDISVLYEIQKYMPFYDRKIEYIVLTHPHDDHLVGLLYILERYEVGQILYYPVCFENNNYEFLLSNFNNLLEVSRGSTIRVEDMNISVIWPIRGSKANNCYRSYNGNINNDSVVLEFEYLNNTFLLMGDAEKEVEKKLITEGMSFSRYNILKAGHHCSKTSSSETFFKRTNPSIVICSAGEGNRFGHPSSETLNIFQSLNVQYLVTYEQGNVQIK